MTNSLIVACAGAGKTNLIIEKALAAISRGKRVLLLTYTINNQRELVSRFCKANGIVPSTLSIKGWFSFLVQDVIRPYQRDVVGRRIDGLAFNSSDPHLINGRPIRGRKEELVNGINPSHYLKEESGKAHTTYLAKLAERIITKTKGLPISRLELLYDEIYIDETQDLVGWDFALLKKLAESKVLSVTCVGDFRQTVYQTAITKKDPKTNKKKLAEYKAIGFIHEQMKENWRSVSEICEFSDLIPNWGEDSPAKTISMRVCEGHVTHSGMFCVREEDVGFYLERISPLVLRDKRNIREDLCKARAAYNFGECKGMEFDHILIIPTKNQIAFLNGNRDAFASGKTDEAVNRFYVAVTRAKYSVAFLSDTCTDTLVKAWIP